MDELPGHTHIMPLGCVHCNNHQVQTQAYVYYTIVDNNIICFIQVLLLDHIHILVLEKKYAHCSLASCFTISSLYK